MSLTSLAADRPFKLHVMGTALCKCSNWGQRQNLNNSSVIWWFWFHQDGLSSTDLSFLYQAIITGKEAVATSEWSQTARISNKNSIHVYKFVRNMDYFFCLRMGYCRMINIKIFNVTNHPPDDFNNNIYIYIYSKDFVHFRSLKCCPVGLDWPEDSSYTCRKRVVWNARTF